MAHSITSSISLREYFYPSSRLLFIKEGVLFQHLPVHERPHPVNYFISEQMPEPVLDYSHCQGNNPQKSIHRS